MNKQSSSKTTFFVAETYLVKLLLTSEIFYDQPLLRSDLSRFFDSLIDAPSYHLLLVTSFRQSDFA